MLPSPLSEQMEPPEVDQIQMGLLRQYLILQTPMILQEVLKATTMLAAVALVEALDFLAQEMVDMALVVVVLPDKIPKTFQELVDMDTWWYMQELLPNYIDIL